MLGNNNVMATIAVKNLDAAKEFYEGVLGLERMPVEESVLAYRSGDSRVLVYESQFAGTNKATAATWAVGDDIERVVAGLKQKGVKFEHYDFPGGRVEGDIHITGNTKAAWMTDPDGNILALVNGQS
jgi:catechol 2,3-dioxygenase-like lactoylglutathione lyase family enzyme